MTNSGDSTASHTAPAKHPYFCIENEMVAIQVENTLFNVHKQQLCHSETFKDMFGVKHTDMVAQGSTLDDPIKLLGISALDFESLLIALYAYHCPAWVLALRVATADSFDPHHIIPAFRLAEMWNFTSLCSHLTKLAEQKLDTVEQAVFAREFGFDNLLEQAYLGLCQRDEPLTSKEASKLGFDGSALVGRLREESCRRFHQVASSCSPARQSFGSNHVFSSTPQTRHATPTAPTTQITGRTPLPCSEEVTCFLTSQIKDFVNGACPQEA
ncbi:hypothetical protein FRC08_002312 [Ceratobasidium sp. 394]|nr:hypothetical protein FRC08_002312 [Ceratobasidium sp. 394]